MWEIQDCITADLSLMDFVRPIGYASVPVLLSDNSFDLVCEDPLQAKLLVAEP